MRLVSDGDVQSKMMNNMSPTECAINHVSAVKSWCTGVVNGGKSVDENAEYGASLIHVHDLSVTQSSSICSWRSPAEVSFCIKVSIAFS